VRATINGEERDITEGLTVDGLLDLLGLGREGIAIAVNEHVIGRAAYKQERLRDGDAVEIIKAVAGG